MKKNGRQEKIGLVYHKQAQKDFGLSKIKYKALFDNMSSGVAIYQVRDDGEDFVFVDFNRAAERIEEICKEDLIGKSVLEVFPGIKEFGLFEIFQQVWKTRKAEHYPVSQYKDKRIVGWRENYICKLPSGEVVAIYDDITERKKAENELARAFAEIKELKEHLEAENIYLKEAVKTESGYGEILGHSNAIKAVLSQVERVANMDSTVFIKGETGTGKELLARAIHKLSPRSDKTMIRVNCAAIPPTLIESELFGHEKGAYTGASSKQIGRFEIADGSTIFLDEIGELSVNLQAKLLHVLEQGQFERLGSPNTVSIDVRVIAATNRDVVAAVREGSFREDLYYRLNVFPIEVPPLRQ